MKERSFVFRLLAAAFAASGVFAHTPVRAGDVTENRIRTLTDGTAVTVTSEAGLGTGVTNVVIDASILTYSLSADITGSSAVTYVLRNEGCFGVTPAARAITLPTARIIAPSLGGTFCKTGPGALKISGANGAVTKPTRFIVREGMVRVVSDYFGGHNAVTTNFVIDVREGATWHAGTGHGAVGPVELTGATWRSETASPYGGTWADTSFKAGVTAHASAIASKMYATSWFILCQPTAGQPTESNCVFNVEKGASLYVYGDMKNGSGLKATVVKRGEGTLYLMGTGYWTGGTRLEAGKIVLGSASALGSATVTVAGDVEMEAVPGVTAICPEIVGAGTVTVGGSGGLTFGKVASTVTGATSKAADAFPPVENGILRLTAKKLEINVPGGETLTVSNAVEVFEGVGEVCDLRKTGDGTLVLGNGLKGKYRKLTVAAGAIEFASESAFGTGGVEVAGGTVRPTANYTQSAVRFTFVGSGRLDVPAGVTFVANSNRLYTANATLTKTGAGDWSLNSCFVNSQAKISGTTWIVDEGRLVLNGGSVFGSHSEAWPGTVEIHENGELRTVSASAHNPMGPVVLRGGTLSMPISQFSSSSFNTEGAAQWVGYAFNGGIRVKASSKPSRVITRYSFTSHESFVPVFDVEDGAVLEMNTSLRRGGTYATGAYAYADGSLVKAGGGALRLLRPLSIKGLFDIQAGTVELAEGGYVDPSAQVCVHNGAKFLLNDGTRFVSSGELRPGVVSDADVWVDATRIAADDGATLVTIANLGLAGGVFKKFPKAVTNRVNGMIPNAPKYVAKGIGGKASIGFDGTMALALDGYVNKTTNCEVFCVGVWTNYYGEGSKGKWGGLVSLGSAKMRGNEDQLNPGVVSGYFDGAKGGTTITTISAIFGYVGSDDTGSRASCAFTSLSPALANNEPFIWRQQRGDKSANFQLWRSDSVFHDKSTTYSTSPSYCQIDRVCLGSRLMTDGCATTYSSGDQTRNLIGQIGEVLVFTKVLTDEERETVNDYLRRKWIGTSAPQSEAAKKSLVGQVEVASSSGARTAFVTTFSGMGPQTVVKTGAGETTLGGGNAAAGLNVSVNEGAVRLQNATLASRVPVWIDAADAETCILDDGGCVTNLVNKGFCGGSFVCAVSRSKTPRCPKRTANGLNGLPTLTFDGESALMTDAYTNKVASRRFSLYAVWRRNQWKLHPGIKDGGGYGKWATVCAFVPNGGSQDELEPGVFHVDDSAERSGYGDFGTGVSGAITLPPTGEPTLFVAHVTTNGYYLSFETNATKIAGVPRTVNSAVAKHEPMNVERIVLGSRTIGGKALYYGTDNVNNRCWYGDLAELIATTEPLSFDEEIELLGYLRKKWFDKGNGSATPPAWLSGTPATPQFGSTTTLALANGVTLVDAADELTLGALETQGETTWVREFDGSAENYSFFDVTGSVSLGSVCLRLAKTPTSAKILSYGESSATPEWTAERPTGRPCRINVFDTGDAYWLSRGGTLFLVK